MRVRNIILIALTLAVVGALVLLFIQSGASSSADVSEDIIDQARQRHQRSQAASHRAAKLANQPVPGTSMKRSTIGTAKSSRSNNNSSSDAPADAADRKRPELAQPNASLSVDQDKSPATADLDTRMQEANRLYDRRDYESALELALETLKEAPGNVRMLRVIVSSACIMGEESKARDAFAQLPERHQRQMLRRCERYGLELTDER